MADLPTGDLLQSGLATVHQYKASMFEKWLVWLALLHMPFMPKNWKTKYTQTLVLDNQRITRASIAGEETEVRLAVGNKTQDKCSGEITESQKCLTYIHSEKTSSISRSKQWEPGLLQ